MPWAVVGAVVGAGISADASRKAGNKQASANDADLAERKRQYDLNREDNERWAMMQINGEEEMDRRNRADKEKAYQRGYSLNKGAIDRGDLAGNQLAFRMGLGPKRGGKAATAASGGVFDAKQYLAENPDLQQIDWIVADPEEHYRRSGQAEGRHRPIVPGTETPGTAAVEATAEDNIGYGGLNERYKDFEFEKDIGYGFRQAEGQTGVNNKLAASGNLLSGAAMKALTRFNQDYASNELSNAYGRYSNDRTAYESSNMNEFNRWLGMQGAGQNAVNSTNGLAGTVNGQASNAYSGIASANQAASNTYGNAFSQYQSNRGDIGAQQQMAYGNAWGKGLQGLQSAWNSYQLNQNKGTSGYNYSGSSNSPTAGNYTNSMDIGYTW